MKNVKIKVLVNTILLFVFLATINIAPADDNTGSSVPDANTYLTPDKMTREDYDMLNEYSAGYNQCLAETSIKQMETWSDPRIVVDFAMKNCASSLEELNRKMIERNFEPNFRESFVHRISNQGANSTLRIVMMEMAAKQSQQEPQQEPQQQTPGK